MCHHGCGPPYLSKSVFQQNFIFMEKAENLPFIPTLDPSNKEAVIWLGELSIIHVTGKETNGRYSVVEVYTTKEGEAPWHVHHREDEAFYILDGEMTIYVGDQVYKAKSGDFVFGPKDVPHMYTVDSPGHVRLLMIFSPAGFEDFVRATSVPASSLVPPPPETVNVDYEAVAKLASQFGAEFVDPPVSSMLD